MPDVLVLYASTHGQTERIALRLCEQLSAEGITPLAVSAEGRVDRRPADFDGVIVGASVHAGHHQSEVVEWARAHAATLNAMPSAFFSVSLSAAEDTDEAKQANRGYIDEFSDATGWYPGSSAAFAGALQYLEYGFMTRLLMRLMMKRGHHPTDTSRDYEYTDWNAVDAFAHAFVAPLARKGAGNYRSGSVANADGGSGP